MRPNVQIDGFESIRVLLVDEEERMRQSLRSSLSARGYVVGEARTRDEAIRLLVRRSFDLVFLEVNTADSEVCRRIRDLQPHLGIIMLAPYDSEHDVVHALNSGADDYVTKPFRFGELLARMRSLTRRVRAAELRLHDESRDVTAGLLVGKLELDLQLRTVKKITGERARLSPKEFSLLVYLMERQGITIGYGELLRAVWGAPFENEIEYLRAYIRLLRKKIENDSAHPEYIVTEPQLGYRFQDRLLRPKERRSRLPNRIGRMKTNSRATTGIL